MNIKQFRIYKVGPYMDGMNWQATVIGDGGNPYAPKYKARGRTAMQALHALFLEIGDDETGSVSEVDGQKSLPAGDGGGLPNCS